MSDIDELVDDVTDVAEGVLSLGKQKLIAIGGVLSGIFGFIADVLQPIAPFAIYLLIFSAVLLALCVVYYLKTKKGLTAGLIMLVATVVLGIVTAIQQFTGSTENGIASEAIPGISSIQKSLGMIQEGIEDIKKDTAAIKDDTKKIDEKTDAIAKNTKETSDSVKKIGEQLGSLRTDGIIDDPKTATDLYHNAKIYELGGDYGNARKAYKAYTEFKTGKLEPHLRLADFLRANEGRAGALEEYSVITRGNNSEVVKYVKILLSPTVSRKDKLIAFQIEHSDFAPVYYHLSLEYSYEKLGQQSLADLRTELKWLTRFDELDQAGASSKYFADKDRLVAWQNDVVSRLKRAVNAKQRMSNPVSVTWLTHNAGITGTLSISEMGVEEIEIRNKGEEDFKSLGLQAYKDPSTGKSMPNSAIDLAPHEAVEKVFEVRYKDINGQWSPIYPVSLEAYHFKGAGVDKNGKVKIDPQTLNISKMTRNSWCSFRYYDDKMLLYFTGVMGYTGILNEIKYSLNSDKLDEVWEFDPYDGPWPAELPEEVDKLYRTVPLGTKFMHVQLTYKDGTKSEVVKVVNQDAR